MRRYTNAGDAAIMAWVDVPLVLRQPNVRTWCFDDDPHRNLPKPVTQMDIFTHAGQIRGDAVGEIMQLTGLGPDDARRALELLV